MSLRRVTQNTSEFRDHGASRTTTLLRAMAGESYNDSMIFNVILRLKSRMSILITIRMEHALTLLPMVSGEAHYFDVRVNPHAPSNPC